MQSRNQYLLTLISKKGGYRLVYKKQRASILDEYCHTTEQNRKYVIRKIQSGAYIHTIRRETKPWSPKQRIRKGKGRDGWVTFLHDPPSLISVTEFDDLTRYGPVFFRP